MDDINKKIQVINEFKFFNDFIYLNKRELTIDGINWFWMVIVKRSKTLINCWWLWFCDCKRIVSIQDHCVEAMPYSISIFEHYIIHQKKLTFYEHEINISILLLCHNCCMWRKYKNEVKIFHSSTPSAKTGLFWSCI